MYHISDIETIDLADNVALCMMFIACYKSGIT